jgi:carboxyl-terminal processing protease
MNKFNYRAIIIIPLLIGSVLFGAGLTKYNAIQQLVLAYVKNSHFNPIAIDDQFSKQVFDLYIERLDPSKKFLLQSDISRLRNSFEYTIDDHIHIGSSKVMTDSVKVLKKRIKKVKTWYPKLLKRPFSFDQNKMIEVDVEKRDYAPNILALKMFWTNYITYQVLNQYLNLVEIENDKISSQNMTLTQESTTKNVTKNIAKKITKKIDLYRIDPTLEKKARKKVKKNMDQLFKLILKKEKSDHFTIYMDSLLNIFDAHTSYFEPKRKEEFDISISGKLEGIGAVLKEDDGYIKVVRIVTGSASWRQGELKADDLILKVGEGSKDPVSIEGAQVRDAVKLIRGKKGKEVRLTVKKPTGKEVVIPIVRDVVVIESTYAKAAVINKKDEPYQLGYIYLPKFYRDFNDKKGRNTTDDTRRLIEILKKSKVDGIVLDLRHNEGGALFDAIQTAGLFIEKGPVVQVNGRANNRAKNRVYRDNDSTLNYSGPLVILHNMYSASAAEILAGALQDYGRAVIVGSDHSFGKGTVQTFIQLDDFKQFSDQFKPMGSLKLTIQKFYRINGDSTQSKGVISDIILPNNQSSLEIGERHLKRALPWTRTGSTAYTQLSKNLYYDQLQKNSQKRIEDSQRFESLDTHFSFIEDQKNKTQRSLSLVNAVKRKQTIDKEEERYEKSQEVDLNLTVTQVKDPFSKDIEEKTIKEWEEGLTKDLYLDESVSILCDLIKLNSPTD